MSRMHQVGAYAAFVQGILFLLLLVLFLVLLPALGLSPNDFGNPSKILPVLNSPTAQLGSLANILFSVTLLLVILALCERMGPEAPWALRFAVNVTAIGSALFLADGMISLIAGGLTDVFKRDPAAATAAFYAWNALDTGLINSAVLAASIGILVWASVALQKRLLPASLCYIALLGGALGVIQLFLVPALLFLFVVNTVWSFWLGAILLRQPEAMRAARMAKS